MRRFFVGLAITAMLGAIPGQARADDRQISQAIVQGLHAQQKSGDLKGISIDLEVQQGTVHLKGTVSNERQEALAVDIARRVPGVRQVYNELEIKAATTRTSGTSSTPAKLLGTASKSESTPVAAKPAAADSKELASQIIGKLKEAKDAGTLRGFSVDVQVEEGVAWLTGKVASPEQQNAMLEIVRRVPGVTKVVNELAIQQVTKAPTDIAAEVVSRLQEKKQSGTLRDFSVDVEVDQGIVWLSGRAASKEQQQLILDTARFVPGVAKVVNDITVQGITMAQAQQAIATSGGREAPQQLPPDLHNSTIGSAVAAGEGSGRQRGSAALADNDLETVVPDYSQVPTASRSSGNSQVPLAFAPARAASYQAPAAAPVSHPMPMQGAGPAGMGGGVHYDHPQMPQYAWPSYAPHPNYGAVTYPKQYSPMAWPYIGPFYPYPQVPLGWRKVELKWKDGWWQLDFKDRY